jgi:hypothetical protein
VKSLRVLLSFFLCRFTQISRLDRMARAEGVPQIAAELRSAIKGILKVIPYDLHLAWLHS